MIDILLTTYNGEKYLNELIESILVQNKYKFKLLIRDDGSVDGTVEIIKYYSKLYPNLIFYYEDKIGNIGSTPSFEYLLNLSTSDYIMFCDQDDIWLPNKIELSYEKIIEYEKKNPDIPLLVFTDMINVDKNLKIINNSFMKSHKFNRLDVDNVYKMFALSAVPGCTIMMNSKVKQYVLPIPNFLVHDHWIATNIVYYGKVVYINKCTVLYRQHDVNSVGVKKINFFYFVRKIKNLKSLILFFKKEIREYSFNINFTIFILYKLKFSIQRMLNI